ncbi:LAMI_0D08746g1_1 [Lachancea mirantina]|uniref:LAMI_0D08746g1_1 n=1 Tax=Lachancea mirantina TaxID=1230905 RepID=A0A1G4JDV7_9SACH|nr:LAMI_0D08746g1_1 [Lachancea mirantina]
MSFKATISKTENQFIWRRTIQTLATLHEDIKFTITPRELIIGSINGTDTSMSQACFRLGFFDAYEFHPEDIVFGEEGQQRFEDQSKNSHRMYSFKVNGKHLSILFRKPDNDDTKLISLAINNTALCPEALTNRLQISIQTENLILKQYAPNINPIKHDPIVISLRYKKRFLDVYGTSTETQEQQLDPRLLQVFQGIASELSQSYFNSDIFNTVRSEENLTPEDEINYLCCDSAIFKNFIDSCSSNLTEEVRLEISVQKLCLTAFTRGIYGRNSDVLRTAMRATNTVSTSDLEHYCIFTTNDSDGGNKSSAKGVNFKLKDFRRFANLTSAWKFESNVHVWFCRPGDPIFFEIDRDDVRLELVLVTDNDISITNPVGNAGALETVKLPYVANTEATGGRSARITTDHRTYVENFSTTNSPARTSLRPKTSVSPIKTPRQLFVEPSQLSQEPPKSQTKNPLQGRRSNGESEDLVPTIDETREPTKVYQAVERTNTTVEWGISSDRLQELSVAADQREILKREKRRYLEQLKTKKKQRLEDDETLGPTQPIKPKGIFD